MDDLHHPAPRLPEGWKQFQADNIDVTTASDLPTAIINTSATGRHSRSPSVLSDHGYPMTSNSVIQPSQIENTSHNPLADALYGNSDPGRHLLSARGGHGGILDPQFPSERPQGMSSHFQNSASSVDDLEYEFRNITSATPGVERRNSSANASNSYFGPHDTAADDRTATLPNLNGVPDHNRNANSNNGNINDYYLSSTDPSSPSPFLNTNTFAAAGESTSPPILQDPSVSPYATYQNSFDQSAFQSTYDTSVAVDNNTLGLHWTHHRTRSDQSDISSNAASPFIGSVHSDHGSPFINPQTDNNNLEDDLHEALLGLDMGAQQFEVATAQYNPHNYDTSDLELDNSGFPLDAPLFPSDRQEQQYPYDQPHHQPTSRPESSSSYHHPPSSQSIFQYNQPHSISTSIPPSFQSPPLPSATSIPEIEVTVAPPTPRTQAFINIESYFSQPYNPTPQRTHGNGQNSPSLPPSYIYSPELPSLSLPAQHGRRRAVSDSGTRPTFAIMPPSNPNALVRRVSSGSHPYLAVRESSASSSGRSSPARGHRKSFSHGGHNMTHREVLELVKNDGPREAKNPKKFICDYPGCGQRFTRNSNKTYPAFLCSELMVRTHMLTHKNERPHVCPHCQKDFTRQHDWKRHMELHDPSKKFKCAGTLSDGTQWGCNKEFARKDALSRHFKSQQVVFPKSTQY